MGLETCKRSVDLHGIGEHCGSSRWELKCYDGATRLDLACHCVMMLSASGQPCIGMFCSSRIITTSVVALYAKRVVAFFFLDFFLREIKFDFLLEQPHGLYKALFVRGSKAGKQAYQDNHRFVDVESLRSSQGGNQPRMVKLKTLSLSFYRKELLGRFKSVTATPVRRRSSTE